MSFTWTGNPPIFPGTAEPQVVRLREVLQWFISEPLNEDQQEQANPMFFGSGTKEGLEKFQSMYGLTVTGSVDAPTVQKLNELLATPDEGPTDEPIEAVEPPIPDPEPIPIIPAVTWKKTELVNLYKYSNGNLADLKSVDEGLYANVRKKAVAQLTDSIKASLKAKLTGKFERFMPYVDRMDLPVREGERIDVNHVWNKVVNAIPPDAPGITDDIREEAKFLSAEFDGPTMLDDVLQPDQPLKNNFLVFDELGKARMYEIGKLAKVKTGTINTLVNKGETYFTLNQKKLASWVDDASLAFNENDAQALGLTANLYHLLGEDEGVVGNLRSKEFASLGNKGIKTLSDLTVMKHEEWVSILPESDAPPEGDAQLKIDLERESKALALRLTVERRFPTETLKVRILDDDFQQIKKDLDVLKPLLSRDGSPAVIGMADFNQLDVEELDEQVVEQLRVSHDSVRRFANRFPGLEVMDVLDDKTLTPTKKMARLKEEVGMVRTVLDLNPGKNIVGWDLSPDSSDLKKVKWPDGLPKNGKEGVLNFLKANQRVNTVTGDWELTKSVLEAGYDSAFSLVRDPLEMIRKKTRLPRLEIARMKEKAESIVIDTGISVEGYRTLFDTYRTNLRFLKGDPSAAVSYLKKLRGWQDLFGDQNYCFCEHCQSILSPAAYFVDLMHWLETHQIVNSPAGVNENHDLRLKSRRPDLWTLELTCAHTTALVPYLDIINRILENYVATRGGFQGELPHDFEERREVEHHVYRDILLWKYGSFAQPFMYPFETFRIYLAHFDTTYGQLATLLGAERAVITKAVLEVSLAEYQLISIPNADRNFLEDLYHLTDEDFLENHALKPLEIPRLSKSMNVTRVDLGALLDTSFVKGSPPAGVMIKSEKKDKKSSIQNDIENIHGMTVAVLGRLHRFTRLWKKLPWSIQELDLVLTHIEKKDVQGDEGDLFLHTIADVLRLQKRFDISVEELCGIWGKLPVVSTHKDRPSLYDRLFNVKGFPQFTKWAATSAPDFTHPSWSGEEPEDVKNEQIASRLQAAFGIVDEELITLFEYLFSVNWLGNGEDLRPIDPTKFKLSIDNLSILYRQTKLAKLLNVSIKEFVQLLRIARAVRPEILGAGYVVNLENVKDLSEFYDWWKSSQYTLSDLALIIGQAENDTADGFDADTFMIRLYEEVQAQKPHMFSDTVLSFVEGVTEEQSSKILKTNEGGLFSLSDQNVPGFSYHFKAEFQENEDPKKSFDPSKDLIIDPQVINPTYPKLEDLDPVTHPSVKAHMDELTKQANAVLIKHHPKEIYPNYLARRFGVTVEKMKALIQLAMERKGKPNDLANSEFTAFLIDGKEGRENVKGLVLTLRPLVALFKDPQITDNLMKTILNTAVEFLHSAKKRESIFGFKKFTREGDGLEQLSIKDHHLIKNIAIFRDLLKGKADTEVENLNEVLKGFSAPANSASTFREVTDLLAKVLDTEKGLVPSLENVAALPDSALEAFETLQRRMAVVQQLGVGGGILKLLISDVQDVDQEYDRMEKLSDAIIAAIRTKYTDEKEREDKVEKFLDKIRGQKRDALTDYLLNSSHPSWKTMNDLYHHFLIDVELEGCARTSELVAAISSVQLYIHRLFMNVEQAHDGSLHVKATEEMGQEWEWRKNYRVWEANRKVFLYPENYIEPDLRDNKTQLFKELEDELLQQEISEQTVLDAYVAYMGGFEEVANLKIAGAYHEKNEAEGWDILHLFGVTPADPPAYYYRRVENATYGLSEGSFKPIWNPWQKIDVQIPVRKVSPIVFQKRLYVFWVELHTASENKISEGSSYFSGYKHTMTVQFIIRRLDGTWAPSQKIALSAAPPFYSGNGVILDPLANLDEMQRIRELVHLILRAHREREGFPEELKLEERKALTLSFPRLLDFLKEYEHSETQGKEWFTKDPTVQAWIRIAQVPKYDKDVHLEPKDDYSLHGYEWDEVYPEVLEETNEESQVVITGRDWKMLSAPIDFYQRSIRQNLKSNLVEFDFRFPSLKQRKTLFYLASYPGRKNLFFGLDDITTLLWVPICFINSR